MEEINNLDFWIDSELERIECEFGSDRGPEYQKQFQEWKKLLNEKCRKQKLLCSLTKLDVKRKISKRINHIAQSKFRSKQKRKKFKKIARGRFDTIALLFSPEYLAFRKAFPF